MISLPEVQLAITQAARPALMPHAPLLVQFINIYIANHADSEDYFRSVILEQIIGSLPATGAVPNQVRAAVIAACDDWCIVENQDLSRTQLMLVPLGGPPAPPQLPPPTRQAHAEDVQRLRRLRTRLARDRGRLLAAAARRMAGWFHWVNSGPVTTGLLALSPNAGRLYAPKEHWDHSPDNHGWYQHAPRRNDFAAWVNATGPIPSPLAHMNCWEAVLFSAFRAGLTTVDWLRFMHRRAALVNEFHRATSDHYGRALSHALGFYDSVHFVPSVGLVPYEGDIVYWSRDEHVAISLGRRWVNGRAEDRLMSHWHNNNGTFSELTLEDLPQGMRTGFRFRPCPF